MGAISIAYYMQQYGARSTNTPFWAMEFPDNSIGLTTVSGVYGDIPEGIRQTRQVTETKSFSNPNPNTGLTEHFTETPSFAINHAWNITDFITDGPQHAFTLPAKQLFPPPVGEFPPAQTMVVDKAYGINPPAIPISQPFSTDITIAPKSTVEVFIEAVFRSVVVPIVVTYRVQGATRFRGHNNNTTIETHSPVGIGTIMSTFGDARVTIVDANTVDVRCGGQYSGELFIQWHLNVQ